MTRKAQEFDREKDQYRPHRFENGTVIYVHGETVDSTAGGIGAVSYFCAHCFEGGVKSYLQPDKVTFGRTSYKCQACSQTVWIPNDEKAEAVYVTRQSPWDAF